MIPQQRKGQGAFWGGDSKKKRRTYRKAFYGKQAKGEPGLIAYSVNLWRFTPPLQILKDRGNKHEKKTRVYNQKQMGLFGQI